MQPTTYRMCIRGRVTERRGSALEGMRLEAGATETVFTSEIRDQSALYGLSTASVMQPHPAADLPTDDKETYRYWCSQTPEGVRLPRIADSTAWRFTEMAQPYEWT